jgi:hypothetical protein
MEGEFGGRHGEDEPSAARVDRVESEHIAEEGPILLRTRGVNDGM